MSRITAGIRDGLADMRRGVAAAPATARGFLRDPRSMTDGAPVWPIGVVVAHTFLDAVDRGGFALILPEVQDEFDLDLAGITSVAAVAIFAGILLSLPVSLWSDRARKRVVFLAVGAAIAAFFSVTAGIAASVGLFVLSRAGFGFGLIVNDPAQQSLLSDYSPVTARPRVFAGRQIADGFGSLVGPLFFGLLATLFTWRAPLIALAVPAALLAVASSRLREPSRGEQERAHAGLTGDDLLADDEVLTLRESYRVLKAIPSVRALWYSVPFLFGGVLVLLTLVPLFFEEEFGLSAGERGALGAVGNVFGITGLFFGAALTKRYLFSDEPQRMFRFMAGVAVVISAGILWLAAVPWFPVVAVGATILVTLFALTLPAYGALLSLIMPPNARTVGFAIFRLWVLPGLVVLPIIGGVGDEHGLRWGIAISVPVFLTGALILANGGKHFRSDMEAAFEASLHAIEARKAVERGDAPALLSCRNVDVRYGQVQVLFGVDLEVREGEMVALLGTNGAGKSTLLRAISGTVGVARGSITFDGVDITQADSGRTAELGAVQVPGGKGVFPSLTVGENLRVASWLHRGDPEHVHAALDHLLERFPVLAERWDTPAGNLSGGEQQMLTLGQALLAKPKLLLIDELSLGLAPTVVQQLLDLVRELHAAGITIVLVEQSVNVALSLCDRAVFLEKGEVRYEGPTAELLDRPDVLRSVFLGKASRRTSASSASSPPRPIGGPVLECAGLVKSFGGLRAVDDVTLTLHEGEVLGLLGANGAGKTTVFDLLSGFLQPDGGTIRFRGHDVTSWSPDRRARVGLGRSFQDARLFPSLTVAEAVAVAFERHLDLRDPLATVLAAPAARDVERSLARKVDALLELLGLEAFRDKFVSELSTGSRRIVDIACALAHEPKVLLLDEPSSGIAQRETEALGPVLLRIRDELGTSLLVIEHDVPLLRSVSNRLVCLEAGHPIAEGEPADVLADPRVVASYLGTDDTAISRSGARTAPGGPS